MKLNEYCRLDGVAIGDLIKKREISSKEVANLAKTAAEIIQSDLNACVEIFDEPISNASQPTSPLSGVPVFLKDILCQYVYFLYILYQPL